MEKIIPYSSLVHVLVLECGEPLVACNEVQEILWQYKKDDMKPYLGDLMLLRKGALQRLRKAARLLNRLRPGAQLSVAYAYRLLLIQEQYFWNQFKKFREQYPNESELEIRERTHMFCASPDVAGHPTGGAVDLTIVGLDMGSEIADFSSSLIRTFHPDLTTQQRKNRALLRRVMMKAGFAPFDGEWWHFSFGDREWAAYYGKPCAIYSQIDYH